MAWFGQKNYGQKIGYVAPNKTPGPYTIAEVGCFLTAQANLLQKFGVNIAPPDLNTLYIQRGIYLRAPEDGPNVYDDLGWNSITGYDGQVKVVNAVDHGIQPSAGWPDTSNAIVKFRYQSISQPHLANGQPNMITHFCMVADAAAKTIVDSWDGVIKSPGVYGQPVAWATYENVVPQPVTPPLPTPAADPAPTPPAPALPTPTAPSPRPGTQYKFQKNDTFYTIAPRFSTTAAALMEYNDITDEEAHNIPVGFAIYVPPAAAPAPKTSGYSIEALSTPKTYHITRSPSANRWAFGNVVNWGDFKPNGSTPLNSNVTITAVATVIVGKDTAAYYMDQLSYKDGQVINTIGYNWSDLAEGAYQAPQPPTPPAPAPEPPKAAPAPQTASTVTITPAANTSIPKSVDNEVSTDANGKISPDAYKTTYHAFPQAKVYEVVKDVQCPECDGRRKDHTLVKGQFVNIAGEFLKGQTLYGRPYGAVKAGYWFGVPMDALESQDLTFNTATTLAEKRALNAKITLGEKLTVMMASAKTSFDKLKK